MEVTLKKQIIQLTGFKNVEKEALVELLFRLDCIYIDSVKFENCTHLIAKQPCKSEKWLAACATGKWILTKDYIIASAESGRWLDETTYEWGYKIERDSHYSPQMQSAPKRWRENLTRIAAPGAFNRWKVALLVKEGHKEREALIRVLKAGKAILCNPHHPDEEVTHVFTSNTSFLTEKEKAVFKAPYYSVQYLGTYLLEEPIEGTTEETREDRQIKANEREDAKEIMTDVQVADMKCSIWKRLCLAQALHHKYVKRDKMLYEGCKVKNGETPRGSLNRIEGLIEGQYFIEAFEELGCLLPSFIPPVCFIQSLFKHLIEGTIHIGCFGRYFDLFYTLLHYHPPWKSTHMTQYYFDLLQCPICKRGTWSLIEMLVRSCLEDISCSCHQPSDLEMKPNERKAIHGALLKFVLNVMQEEAKALSAMLCECTDSQYNVLSQSVTVHIFWSENRTLKLLTKQMITLTDWVARSHKEKYQIDDVVIQDAAYQLNRMLGAAVEYWILIGFYLDKNLLHQVVDDLTFYICVQCEDFSLEEKETFVCSIASPWLQMFVAEVIFKNLCMKSNFNTSADPLSLEKLLCSYIPVLWGVGTCGNEKMQKIKGKGKIGQQPFQQSQGALMMLNGEKQNQGEVLLDLPVLSKLRRKSMGRSFCTKENHLSAVQGLPLIRRGTKGETALHKACINNKVKTCILLLRSPGIDINVKDNAGWTPLHEACNHGSTECVREILQRCPEVDLLSHVDGVTPLHDALLNGHVEIGKMLLQYGGPAILQHKDSDGKFPLDYVSSPQLKKELFDIVLLDETVEDFHKHAALEFHNHNIEFSA
ncbi:SMC5-SMC6 complex localization factor protein 1 isoform X1 [Ascaphus truei]|uniref:SMC5-SMC6 complex localization factor protein 1 isoform X1 n=1 Tax=Ascaphus truei TaxID=8439 RepID=UPI003F5A592B